MQEGDSAQETALNTVAVVRAMPSKGDLRYLRELLKNKIASDLFPPQRQALVTVKKNDLISHAFKKLIDHGILSAPVYDMRTHAFIGFIDMVDMVAHVLNALSEGELTQEEDLTKLLESKERFANDTCETLTDLSQRNPWYPVESSVPVLTVVNLVARVKVHRIPAISKDNELSTVITQSHIVRLFSQHIAHFGEITEMTVGALRLGYCDVITINQNEKTVEAFKKMHNAGVSAVAVVDDNGILVGNVSNTDLKVIGYDAALLSHLFIPITEFLSKLPHNEVISGPIAVTPQSTFEEVVLKLQLTRVHRVYVVEAGKPIGVISGLEIIQAINALLD